MHAGGILRRKAENIKPLIVQGKCEINTLSRTLTGTGKVFLGEFNDNNTGWPIENSLEGIATRKRFWRGNPETR